MTRKRVNLIKARKKQKLTIRAVAKQLHVSKSSYSNYEQGKRRPRKYIAFEICKFYGKPLSVLFLANHLNYLKLEKREAVRTMLSKELIVQAIINAYSIDGFVVSNDNTDVKTNEQTDKSTGGKATIYNKFEADKGGDEVCFL